MSYKEDIKIDKYALDEEWLNHTGKFVQWGEAEADALEAVDRAENQLELTEADLDKKIRENPALYGIKDIKEKAVSSAIIAQAEYQAARNAVFIAKKNARIMALAKKAFSHHEKSLDRLTDLYLSGYWAEKPSEKKIAQATSNVADKQFKEEMQKRRLRRREDGSSTVPD